MFNISSISCVSARINPHLMWNLNTSIFIGARGILTMLWAWRLTCLARGTSLCRILVKSTTRTCTPPVIRSFIMLWQWWMERGRRTKPWKLKRYDVWRWLTGHFLPEKALFNLIKEVLFQLDCKFKNSCEQLIYTGFLSINLSINSHWIGC